MSTTYHVVVTREGGNWLADVPQLQGTHTWAHTLRKLDEHVREAIALAEELDEGAEAGLRLRWDYRSGDPDIDVEATRLRDEREQLDAAERRLAAETAAHARRLRDRLSVRDTAAVLGVSPQRVSQVAPEQQAGEVVSPQVARSKARAKRTKPRKRVPA